MALFIHKVTQRASQRLTLSQRKSLLGAIQTEGGSSPTTIGSAATVTTLARADRRLHTGVQSPPATQAGAIYGTAPVLVDQN